MCLLWHRESYGFLHTICLHQKNKKLPSFLWHMLSCVFWQEKTCFAVQNPQLWKVRLCPFCLCMHLWVCVCPSRPPPVPPDRRPRGWSTGKPTLKFNSDLKIVMSWWCHDDDTMISKFEMPKIWSCQILRIKKSWSCQIVRTPKIWSCQKLRCTKNLMMSKSENPKNLIMSKMWIQDSEKFWCWCHRDNMINFFLQCLFPPRIPEWFMNFYKHVFLFFYVSSMMMLSCPCGHDLKTWSSQNLMRSYVDDQKILIMSKFENTKKWSCENDECRAGSHPGYLHFWVSWYFDHVIFWESRNFGHERNRIRYDICAGRQLFGCLGDLSVGVCVCVSL